MTALALLGATACLEPGIAPPSEVVGDDVASLAVDLSGTPLRRLSQRELIDSIRALTGVDATVEVQALPADGQTPFDNDVATQFASLAFVEGMGFMASSVAERAFARGLTDEPAPEVDALSVVAEAEDPSTHVARDGQSGIAIFPGYEGDAGFTTFRGEAGVRASIAIDEAHAGSYSVEVVGAGLGGDDPATPGPDTPLVELRVDGAVQTTFEFPEAVVVTRTHTVVLAAGTHVIDAVFANDFYDPQTGVDRNLALDHVAITGPLEAQARDDGPGAGPASPIALLGCSPTGPTDAVCFEDFVATFGRRVLRRPLSAEEIEGYARFLDAAAEDEDFLDGAKLVVAAMLQDVEFLHRIESLPAETPEGEVAPLDGFAVAARLSFLLWGQGPDDELLDLAASNALLDPAQRRAAATRMLADPRARSRIVRMHAMWLGTEDALTRVPASLRPSLQREAAALIERIVFDEGRSWSELFTEDLSLIDDTLAEHYGLDAPGTPTLMSMSGTGRAGLLGQGSFLAVGAKFDDTSPTQRGKAIRARLLCQEIPTPTPADLGDVVINTDAPPPGEGCKSDRYAAHAVGSCLDCHVAMDPIGFGLEAYDRFGRFRTHEPGTGDLCPIDGIGALDGVPFQGPAELGALLNADPAFTSCFARQLLRFTLGRHEEPAEEDGIGSMELSFAQGDHALLPLLLDLIATDTFASRRLPVFSEP